MKKQLAILLMISLLMGAAAETSQRDEQAATLAARMVHKGWPRWVCRTH